jgi:membrane protein DedA with SNARE-associated domain
MDITALTSQFMVWANEIILSLGYIGVFFVNFIASCSIIFPIPAFLLVFTLGAFMNPWLIGLSAGAGAALGELVGYGVGKGSGKVIEKKYKKVIELGKKWIKGHKSFPVIVLFAATPLPDDVVGIVCGIFNYNIKKFILASFIGKVIMNTALAWGGFYGSRWLADVFSSSDISIWLLIGLAIVGVMLTSLFRFKMKKR